MSGTRQGVGLTVFVALCLGAGGLGALVTTPEINGWYATLIKPAWSPPDSLFGPVWTTLFVLMAVAGWLVWKRGEDRVVPLSLFVLQLGLNVAWSWIFFGLRRPGMAFLEIIVLWMTITATLIAFFHRSKLAGWMLLPYLSWVTFAAALNFSIWRQNA